MQKSLMKRESELFANIFKDPEEHGRAIFYLAVSLSCLVLVVALNFVR